MKLPPIIHRSPFNTDSIEMIDISSGHSNPTHSEITNVKIIAEVILACYPLVELTPGVNSIESIIETNFGKFHKYIYI